MSNEVKPTSAVELTVISLLTGIILSVVMGAANVYLGLRVGMTVSASIPAAVLAMGLLQGVFRKKSILEANIVQTTASAGESLAAGIIFTMPALVIAGIWERFDFWTTSLIALTGGLMGVLMMIPMRKAIVLNSPDLKFPEGVACAEVLHAGMDDDDASGGSRLVFGGLAAGAVIKLLMGYIGVLASKVVWATRAGSRTLYFGSELSPALVGVGVIVGLPIAVQIFLGGALGWQVLIPLMSSDYVVAGGAIPESAADHADFVWATRVRFIGVGAMVVGGVVAIWRVRNGILSAFRELAGQFRRDEPTGDATEQNLELKYLAALSTACGLGVFLVYYFLLGRAVGIAILATVVGIILSFFFTAVASYIVGLVGNSNSPVSGMTITALLATGLFLYLAGYSGEPAILAMLGVAGVVCCVTCTSGDVCNDLKTGHLVGASPRSQQIAQVLGVIVAAFVMAPVLTILHEGSLKAGTGGIGGKELGAPQAGLFASLSTGFFGDGNIPWDMVAWGAVLAVLIGAADLLLARRESAFRLHIMPVAVGIYLPGEVTVPILFGGIISWLVHRTAADKPLAERRGVLMASGIIAGESLTGVLLGLLAFFDFKALDFGKQLGSGIVNALSLAVFAATLFALYRLSEKRQ